MKNLKKQIGFFSGIAICVLICLLPLQGIPREGKLCLAFTLMTVVWWSTQVAQSGFVGGFYLMLLCLFKLAEPSAIFAAWTGSTIWLVIGAYLIASAVRTSGLGERLSYAFILKFVRGWKSIIISIFALTCVLSILIPHPWPRAFLIMSVMMVVIKAAQIPRKDAVTIGFTVFAASVPVSMIFLTGDATINLMAASFSDEPLSFARWFQVIGPPAMLLSILTLILILILFPSCTTVCMDLDHVRQAQKELGSMSVREKRTLIWMIIAILLWLTNGVTGLDIGWITFSISMLMSLPVVGEVLGPKDWREVPVHVVIFLTAAMAIGKVGAVTGMNAWIVDTILPDNLPESPLLMGLFIVLIAAVIHMFMGSVVAVMGVTVPALLTFADSMGIPTLVIIGLVHLAVAGHYVLPFHHLTILVGQGKENGMYSQEETIKMGIPLFAAILVTAAFALWWWTIIGLL